MPHSPEAGPRVEFQATPPEAKPEQQELTAEQVVKTWRYLGLLKANLENEDPYLEFATRLTMPEDKFIGIQRREADGYREANATAQARLESEEDPAQKEAEKEKLEARSQAQKIKLNSILYMRKLARGGDERMAVPVHEAQAYLQASIAKQKKKMAATRPPSARQLATLQWLEQTRAQLEETIIKPFYGAEAEGDETPPIADGATIVRLEEKEETESEAEKKRFARLAQAVEQKLPTQYRLCAPEIVQLLKASGFNFIERDDVTGQNGKTQAVTRFVLFADPRRSESKENFSGTATQDYEHALRRFEDDFKKITTSPATAARLKIALHKFFNQRRWNFASQADATAILNYQHAQEPKPYAIYMKDERADLNLAAIEAQSGKIRFHRQPTDKVPDYKDETVFSALPVFTIDIKKE